MSLRLDLPDRDDADLISTALLIAAGTIPGDYLTADQRQHARHLAAEIRNGLVAAQMASNRNRRLRRRPWLEGVA